jgi:hypothetical protein
MAQKLLKRLNDAKTSDNILNDAKITLKDSKWRKKITE